MGEAANTASGVLFPASLKNIFQDIPSETAFFAGIQ